ncbi:MAG: hypothetical protein K2X81_04875 [Candidatus Obscuribacterales bacterium]|nr:hypothetical protein [Candidatus Obscuribacterales bacterium]
MISTIYLVSSSVFIFTLLFVFNTQINGTDQLSNVCADTVNGLDQATVIILPLTLLISCICETLTRRTPATGHSLPKMRSNNRATHGVAPTKTASIKTANTKKESTKSANTKTEFTKTAA